MLDKLDLRKASVNTSVEGHRIRKEGSQAEERKGEKRMVEMDVGQIAFESFDEHERMVEKEGGKEGGKNHVVVVDREEERENIIS